MAYFSDLDQKRFSFESRAMGTDKDTFGVINFKGFEAVSKTYEFDIFLVSTAIELDLEEVLQSSAVFMIHRGDNDDVLFNGILADFEQLHEFNDHVYYRAKLVPKFWWLNLTTHNQVFLDESVPKLVELALIDSELEPQDFDMQSLAASDYEPRDYVCQYDESHFQFVSRWLEREGIYYYFDQEADGEKLIFSDDCTTDEPLLAGSDLLYQPATGLESTHLSEVIYSFTCRQKQLPKNVILKDYDYENPSLDVKGEADVDPRGRGTKYIYGHYFKTPEEGDRLAQIFAEQLLSEKQCFYGESRVPYMVPGFTFTLSNHYRNDYNQDYFIVEVTHEGSQAGCLSPAVAAGVGSLGTTTADDTISYHNSFKAIPASTQFRPEKITERPRISGTLHAKIDAEGEGEYAQMDEFGRYKVRLPFDVNADHMDGRASTFIRMMQPYAGENKGMQFPLTKGTEVMLTFTDGHPDRPLIAGAVNNHSTPGPVNADNQSESVIQTGGTNKIRMEDKKGSERILMESPHSDSWIRIGAHNDPVTLNGPGTINVPIGGVYFEPGASSLVDGGDADTETNTIDYPTSVNKPDGSEYTETSTTDKKAVIDTSIEGSWELIYNHGGNRQTRHVNVWTTGALDSEPGDGIRIRTSSDLYLESNARDGEYTILRGNTKATLGLSENAQYGETISESYSGDGEEYRPYNGNLMDKFTEGTYNPENNLSYITGKAVNSNNSHSAGSFRALLEHAKVKVSSVDTVTTQEGNIYDFGGYWNYNLGNSFAEEHINQSADLNRKNSYEFASSATQNTDHTKKGGSAITDFAIGMTVLPLVPHLSSIGGAIAVGITQGFVGGMLNLHAKSSLEKSSGLSVRSTGFKENIADVIAGPGEQKIETWAGVVGSSFEDIDPDTGKPNDDCDFSQSTDPGAKAGPMHTNSTWVTKQFGDSYTYARGNDIDIRIGNTESHQHGNTAEFVYAGVHEETKFNGDGIKVTYERGGGGSRTEINWHRQTGDLTSVSYGQDSWFSYEANFVSVPKVSVATNLSTLNLDLKASLGALNISADLSAGISMKIESTLGLSFEMEKAIGGKIEVNENTFGMQYQGTGSEFKKEAALKATITNLILTKEALNLTSKDLELKDKLLEVKTGKLGVDVGTTFKFS